jgi:non-canonical purine NTP pyrophosphatase (RdgB/HAM1 family)
MQRIPVESSDLVAIGYDEKTRIMEIEFKESRIYQYYDVEPPIYERFMKADSYGQYFYAFVNGHYRYKRIEQNGEPSVHKPLAFVTSNAGKYLHMCAACQPLGIDIEQLILPVDEIQSHDPEKIAVHKAKEAFRLARRPVVANDAYWNILALRGFPGAFMSYMNEWLRAEDIIKLMEGKTERTITCEETLVYYDGKRSKIFTQTFSGQVATEPRGNGRPFSQVTILHGDTQTLAEINEAHNGRYEGNFEHLLWRDFAKWYKMQQRLKLV